MPKNRELQRLVNKISWGVIETLSGLVLYQLALGVAITTTSSGKSSKVAGKAIQEADLLSERLMVEFSPDKLRSAFYQLRRKGLINTIKGKRYEAEVTERGLKKLRQELSSYQEERLWDKRVYLVTYDIEERDRRLRKKLHQYLRQIGCAPLQKSTFISVYNPRGLIRDWTKNNSVYGDIWVSDLGPDGALGDKPLQDIIRDVYQLDRINIAYGQFLTDYPGSSKDNPAQKQAAFFSYNAILQEDPQLPFELLFDDWLGDRAYQRYREIVGDKL